jgi:hypothetical protein
VSGAALAAPASFSAPAPRGWINTPAYDLALFTLSPIAGLLVLWANFNLPGGTMVVLAATYFVGIPHYLSSFTFYLGDENLAYYKSRRLAFFVGPVLILAAVAGLRGLGVYQPVLIAMFVWNIWHVSLQSAGILSIYRRLNGGALDERPVAHLAILSVNATLAFWFIDRFQPLYQVLIRIHPLAPWALRAVCLPIAVCSLILLAMRLARRPQPVSLPEKAFLTSSLLLFHPYLWVQDSSLATFGMLMGHFIQYLAIVWLLHRRKYAASPGSVHQRVLGWISARPAMTVSMCIATGLVFYGFDRVTAILGAPAVYLVAWNALTLVHFYLDGLIWAFKQPFVRQTMGPYLTPAARMAA